MEKTLTNKHFWLADCDDPYVKVCLECGKRYETAYDDSVPCKPDRS